MTVRVAEPHEADEILRVTNAAYQVEMNAKRIETTRAARELAEQRLDAERKRLDVGMSTSFLVIQAQRDLAQAKSNELGAILSYDLALVSYDALQEAAPAGQGGGGATTSGASSTVASLAATAGAIGASTTPTTGAAGTRTTTPISALPGVQQQQ